MYEVILLGIMIAVKQVSLEVANAGVALQAWIASEWMLIWADELAPVLNHSLPQTGLEQRVFHLSGLEHLTGLETGLGLSKGLGGLGGRLILGIGVRILTKVLLDLGH